VTKDYTPLGPDVVEQKYYARGVGFVLAVHIKGPGARIERVKVEQLAPVRGRLSPVRTHPRSGSDDPPLRNAQPELTSDLLALRRAWSTGRPRLTSASSG